MRSKTVVTIKTGTLVEFEDYAIPESATDAKPPHPTKSRSKTQKGKGNSRAQLQTKKDARIDDPGDTITESLDHPLVSFEEYADSDPSGEPEVVIMGGLPPKNRSKKTKSKVKSRSNRQAAKASRSKKARKR